LAAFKTLAAKASRLMRSAAELSALRASLLFGLSGGFFAMGNLLLARTMPVEEFGKLALLVSILNIAVFVAPFGVDQLLMRWPARATAGMLAKLSALAFIVAVAAGLAASLVYGLDAPSVASLGAATIAGGLSVAASGALRRLHVRELSVLLITGSNFMLAACGLASLALAFGAVEVMAAIAVSYAALAAIGWLRWRMLGADTARLDIMDHWREVMALVGLTTANAFSVQLERLVLPAMSTVEDLATYAVLSSAAMFPFRIVTTSAGFSLAPLLRTARDRSERLRLIRRELGTLLALLVAAACGVVALAPTVAALITGGRYPLSTSLVLIACFSGSVKVIQALLRTILIGCGDAASLAWLNMASALGILLSVALAFLASGWGLPGILLGVAFGGLIASLPAVVLTHRALGRVSPPDASEVT
jgi:O-antigen/teichoic acid export membrane protein